MKSGPSALEPRTASVRAGKGVAGNDRCKSTGLELFIQKNTLTTQPPMEDIARAFCAQFQQVFTVDADAGTVDANAADMDTFLTEFRLDSARSSRCLVAPAAQDAGVTGVRLLPHRVRQEQGVFESVGHHKVVVPCTLIDTYTTASCSTCLLLLPVDTRVGLDRRSSHASPKAK